MYLKIRKNGKLYIFVTKKVIYYIGKHHKVMFVVMFFTHLE